MSNAGGNQAWSQEQHVELHELTDQILSRIKDTIVADCIAVVHGYEDLVMKYPNDLNLWRKLRGYILDLARHLETRGNKTIAARLRAIAPIE